MMDKKILCTICARGGSKGVKGKNIRPMHGTPLIGYTINQAKECGLFSYIAVSSDSQEIREVAKDYGADFVIERPDELASDTAGKTPAIRHCAEEVEAISGETFDIFVDLDATAPLRLASDITGAVEMLVSEGVGNVITGAPAHRSPYFNLVEEADNGCVRLVKSLKEKVLRRQDAPQCFDMNASIYVWNRQSFLQGPAVFGQDTKLFEMPQERSVDIDSELDWDIVELILSKREKGTMT